MISSGNGGTSEINAWVAQLNWIANEDRLQSQVQTGEHCTELAVWEHVQAIFSLAGKNRGGYEYVFVVQRAGKRLLEKYDYEERKVQLS